MYDILRDGCNNFHRRLGGDTSIFAAESLEWSCTRKVPTCDYCCCFAAAAADDGDGALYWCCSIFTAAPAAALLYC